MPDINTGHMPLVCASNHRRTVARKEYGGEGGIPPKHPKKFPVAMVKLKSFRVNQRILEKPFCQCQWAI
jgi:hypothetical protein